MRRRWMRRSRTSCRGNSRTGHDAGGEPLDDMNEGRVAQAVGIDSIHAPHVGQEERLAAPAAARQAGAG